MYQAAVIRDTHFIVSIRETRPEVVQRIHEVTEDRLPIRMFVYDYEQEGSVNAGNFLMACVLTCQYPEVILMSFIDQFTVKQGMKTQREIIGICVL